LHTQITILKYLRLFHFCFNRLFLTVIVSNFHKSLRTLSSCTATTVCSCSSVYRHNVRRNHEVYLFSTPSNSFPPHPHSLYRLCSHIYRYYFGYPRAKSLPAPVHSPVIFRLQVRLYMMHIYIIYIMFIFMHKNIKYIYAHIHILYMYRCIIYIYI